MRARPGASIDPEQTLALHDLALAAELSYVWSTQLTRALDAYAQAARSFLQDYQAGKSPDPVPLLVRFGAANELLDQIEDRFEIGAEALAGLHFALANPSQAVNPSPARVRPEQGPENLVLLRPEVKRPSRSRSKP